METLPTWLWIAYYIFIFLTLISGIVNWARQVYSPLAAITIIFSLLVPLVGFIYYIGRPDGLNEYEYVSAQFQKRDLWSLFIILTHFYFIVWWFLFLNIWNWLKKVPPYTEMLIGKIKSWKKKEQV
ncbi:hypothetical protein [Oceanobacillus damuensis]|uniref:hypothetical protein n=1 Tax=Oceanobacillus damuensis TaxID=937928 RepID=UPI000836057C|nr:hypothetical protein [Oceanobacillus damuensis]